ncbi:hypothetical protein [Cytobacillus sp. IB215316]|uniref:hypothetical protein n=1 Tax=Cytobacillus sp. IB215316 TaxID=3097354 RepID=UPI002A0F2359|nr:hypothetical protein [Cytobacillus sp. IB215316]MDX8361731.1 hypothetical protein [Cytobacillus sp. IB215316]
MKLKTHSNIATILVGPAPINVCFTLCGKVAYVINASAGTISVIVVKTHSGIANVSNGGNLRFLAFPSN